MTFTNDFFSPLSSEESYENVQLIDSYTYEIHYYEKINSLPPSFSPPNEVDEVIFRSRLHNGITSYYVNKTIYESSLGINAKMFGIIADNVTNDRNNLQKAIETTLKLGRRLLLPAGKIWLGDLPLTVNLDLTPYTNYSIYGLGSESTQLGSQSNTTVFDIFSASSRYNFEMVGLKIKRNGSDPSLIPTPEPPYLRDGVGITAKNINNIKMDDISIVEFNYGVIFTDIVYAYYNRMVLIGNNIGFLAHRVNPSNHLGILSTNPNVYNFVNCRFADNRQFGCQMRNIHNVKFDSCIFEINNVTIDISFNSNDGRNSLNVINSYFEGNKKDAYLSLESHGTHNFIGNIFNRLLPTNDYSIVFENANSSNIQVINLLGNGFKNGGTYPLTQNLQPVYFIGTPSKYYVMDTNMYEKPGDYPDYTDMNVIKLL